MSETAPSSAPRVAVMRDGEVLVIVDTANDAFRWLLDHQSASVDHATKHEGYAIVSAEPWPTEAAADDPHGYRTRGQLAAMARREMIGDDWHRSGGCVREGVDGRSNCSTCVLHGYRPRGGWGDPELDKRGAGPNYAGWARVYVEAGYAIPRKWWDAFRAQRESDNLAYAFALERSIATFGVKAG